MVKVDRRSARTAEEEDASSSSGSSSYEWVTDSEQSDEEVAPAMVRASCAFALFVSCQLASESYEIGSPSSNIIPAQLAPSLATPCS